MSGRKSSLILIVLGVLTATAFSSITAWAADGAYGDGSYGACTYNSCGITLASNGTVSLPVTPASGIKCTVQSDAVAVTTDSSTGYTLTFKNSATNSNLSSGSGNIPTSGATTSAPTVLAANTWGYRVDGLGSFGAGPTSAATNVAVPGVTFAGVPTSSASADTLATSSVAANPTVTTNVWYGVCVDTSVTAATYSSSVTYTAVVN